MSNICPVCGYDGLHEPAYDDTEPSYEICPSCGYQFGYHDDAVGITQEQWRAKWIEDGMKWWSSGRKPSASWKPKEQLRNINVFVE